MKGHIHVDDALNIPYMFNTPQGNSTIFLHEYYGFAMNPNIIFFL